jgi:dihydroorotase (multifunctional complex type)
MVARVLDTVLRGGKAVLPDGTTVEIDIGVAGGRIEAIAAPGALAGEATADLKGLLVMPGVVDAHIHLGHGSDISRPRAASDAETESAAAAVGGVTTFLSYVISGKPFEPALIDEICAVTAAGSRVDFGLHLVISTEEQLAGVPDYAKAYGIPSFKLFMYSRGGEGMRIGLPDIDDGFLFRLAEAVARCGGILCPHCENIEVAWVLGRRLMAADPQGKGGLAAWNDSRPPFVEAEAVHRVATLARQAGAPVYMVHCTSAAALEAALAQRRLGTDLTVETCTHYLTHTIDWKGSDLGKVGPPIRTASDTEALWAALKAGSIDVVATDHVHRHVAAKAGGIWKASPGFPGLQTLLPVLLGEGYHKRGLPLNTIARVLSQNPARAMGCQNKGAIAVGRDADFAIVDLNRTWVADNAGMHSDAGFSIYDGWRFQGKVIHSMVRGRFVYRDEQLCGDAVGHGRYVRRSLAPVPATA